MGLSLSWSLNNNQLFLSLRNYDFVSVVSVLILVRLYPYTSGPCKALSKITNKNLLYMCYPRVYSQIESYTIYETSLSNNSIIFSTQNFTTPTETVLSRYYVTHKNPPPNYATTEQLMLCHF